MKVPGTSGRASATLLLALAASACGGAAAARTTHTGHARTSHTLAATQVLHVSPRGDDGGACTRSHPCRSWAVAYREARAGAVVELASGDYGDVALKNLPRKSGRVVFRPARGARVKVGDIDIDGTSNVEIRRVTSDEGWEVRGMASHVTLRDVRVLDSQWGAYLGGSRHVRVIGGEIGRIDPNDGLHMNNADGENYDTVIDGLYMHDLTRNRDPSVHTDCLQAGSANGLVIRNSRFVNCATQGIFLNPYNGGTTRNVQIENTWLGPAQLGYNALYIGGARNVTIRNDSIVGGGAYIESPASRVRMTGNIIAGGDPYGCDLLAERSLQFAYNVSDHRCSGAAHHTVDPGLRREFVDPSSARSSRFDLHLRRGAKAINRGDPSSYPKSDYDGGRRPVGGRPDAGADEYGTKQRRR